MIQPSLLETLLHSGFLFGAGIALRAPMPRFLLASVVLPVWVEEEIFGESFAPGAVVCGYGLFAAVVDVKTGVLQGEEGGR